jgi:hypothetical protein
VYTYPPPPPGASAVRMGLAVLQYGNLGSLACGLLGATGSHVTNHPLQREKTFLNIKLSGTSDGKRTWPRSKQDEERASKRMRGDGSHTLAAATAASQASQSLGGYTDIGDSQET